MYGRMWGSGGASEREREREREREAKRERGCNQKSETSFVCLGKIDMRNKISIPVV